MSHFSITEQLIELTQKQGATHVEVLYAKGETTDIATLNGRPERFETALSDTVGLRVIVGKRQAVGRTSDTSPASLARLAETITAMAKISPEDPHLVYADLHQLCKNVTKNIEMLNLCDNSSSPHAGELLSIAQELETEGLAHRAITKSGGAWASNNYNDIEMMFSNGFATSYRSSSFSYGVELLAGSGLTMTRDYDYSVARHFNKLKNIKTIAATAARGAAGQQGAQPITGGKFPVVFDRRTARSLLGHLAGAINAASIVRQSSFLKDAMGQQLFDKNVTIFDNPLLVEGLGSHPCDGEGLNHTQIDFIKEGVLTDWIFDLTTAHKLGLKSNGRAARGVGNLPHPATSNFILANGALSFADVLKDIQEGFFVTNLIGDGVNPVTGDYSRGFSGFRIRAGALAEPVQEMTIAGTLQEMFRTLVPLNNLELDSATASPAILVPHMYISGK